MQYEAFITRVRENGPFDSRDEAERLIEVALSTLSELVYRSEREDLAAELPAELKQYVLQPAPEQMREETAGYPLEQFYTLISSRADVAYERGIQQAKAIVAVLQEAVSAGQMAQVRQELPAEYNQLFDRD